MKEEEIQKLEKEQRKIDEKYKAEEVHVERIMAISSLLPKPKRFKECPKCTKRLKEKGYRNCIYYKCVCGYEYAKTWEVDSRG